MANCLADLRCPFVPFLRDTSHQDRRGSLEKPNGFLSHYAKLDIHGNVYNTHITVCSFAHIDYASRPA